MFDPIQMPWLPAPETSFRNSVKALKAEMPDVGQKIVDLATHRLTNRDALLLSKKLSKLQKSTTKLEPLADFKLSVLSNCTADLILDVLPVAAARHHLNLTTNLGEFGQIMQDAINPDSNVFKDNPDAILLMLDHRWYDRETFEIDKEAFVDRAMDKLVMVLDAIEQSSSGAIQIILQTIAPPAQQLFGSFDRVVGKVTMRDIDALNSAIVALSQKRGCLILDIATLGEIIGTARFHDFVSYNLYKLPFASAVAPLFCDWIARLLAAVRGKTRKCLVLDLDNTIWGGAIGDEGLEGIILGPGDAAGEAFLAIQSFASSLKNRGIILAVCSKNDEAIARSAFQMHPEMLLKEDDIAVFTANWHDKASNIKAIASALNIGTDALVFLDDNPIERALVRRTLPLVAVPEVDNDPVNYLATLGAAGYFEALTFSKEDVDRAQSYVSNVRRLELRAEFRDLGDYLTSLEMEVEFCDFRKVDRPRVVQLINKTNQFNLTNQRYTEAAITDMEVSSKFLGRSCRLKDKFGDFGIIGITIVNKIKSDHWAIDTWLMSCRVMGREVEYAMLNDLIKLARANKILTLRAHFLPTGKNTVVSEMYDRLGFERTSGPIGDAAEFLLDVTAFEMSEPHLDVKF